MADINQVVLVGRLTRDAELRFTNSGMGVCKFSIANNRRKRSGDSWEDEVSFFDCTMFGKRAESLNQYLNKGKQVAVVGELRQSRWEQEGQNRSKIEVIVNDLQFLGSTGGGSQGGGSSQGGGNFNNNRGNQGSSDFGDYNGPDVNSFEDDIPF